MRIHDDRVFIEDYQPKRESILDIPFNDNEPIVHGKIAYIGDLVDKNKEGDIILYEKHMSIPVTVEGKKYFILRKADIIATI